MPELTATPIAAAEFADRLEPLIADGVDALGVAVSGGPDSLALFHLADHWAREAGRALHVYTVDHGLRADSASEAAAVAATAAARGRSHRVLVWSGHKPGHGLQEAARSARYRLLCDACRGDGAAALLLAHHLDDQAETVLHRIDRHTGPDGLAAMARARTAGGVALLRPLLDIPKARLVATCRAAGLAWVEDPSNRDPRFARSELRALAAPLAEAGVTVERLGRLAAAMTSVRAALDGYAGEWMAAHAEISAAGAVTLDRAALLGAPSTLRRRLVERTLRAAGGACYPARGERLDRLLAWVEADRPADGARTLGGCRVERSGDTVRVLRDWRQADRAVIVAGHGLTRWDGRFEVHNRGAAPVRVGACGEEGWRRWRRTERGRAAASGVGIPHAARLALPAVVDLDGGIALPHLVTSAPAPSGWVGEVVRVRFRPTVPFP